MNEKLNTAYENFKEEAELFFVSKFVDSSKISEAFKNCLDICFNITKTVDATKGIIASSSHYGQGKTFFFDVLQHRYRRKFGRNFFVKTSAKELAAIYTTADKNTNPQIALDKFIKCKNLFIDDIGEEGSNKTFYHYSNSLNVITYVLLKRYEYWRDRGWKTYGTTNLTKSELSTEYGGRVMDRIEQMCYLQSFSFVAGGKSFRQFKDVRTLSSEEAKANLERLRVQEVKESIDVVGYLNDLLDEDEDYLMIKDWNRWSFVKPYLLERKLVDLSLYDEEMLERAEKLAIMEAKDSSKSSLKHAGDTLQKVISKKAGKTVNRDDKFRILECLLVRDAFLALRTRKYRFQ